MVLNLKPSHPKIIPVLNSINIFFHTPHIFLILSLEDTILKHLFCKYFIFSKTILTQNYFVHQVFLGSWVFCYRSQFDRGTCLNQQKWEIEKIWKNNLVKFCQYKSRQWTPQTSFSYVALNETLRLPSVYWFTCGWNTTIMPLGFVIYNSTMVPEWFTTINHKCAKILLWKYHFYK